MSPEVRKKLQLTFSQKQYVKKKDLNTEDMKKAQRTQKNKMKIEN